MAEDAFVCQECLAIVRGSRMSREREIVNVATVNQSVWLAAQLDELEREFLGRMDKMTTELVATRKVLQGLLIAIIASMVIIPITILWAKAIT